VADILHMAMLDAPSWYFRFWQLVRSEDGSYYAAPYITIYDGMVEIAQVGDGS